MDTLLLRDVRCFRGEHAAPLAPLTLLIGENSSGKSTLLALTRIAWDLAFSASEPNFNEDPFGLGAYDDIAHFHGGRGKRAKEFSVGLKLRGSRPSAHQPGSDGTLSIEGVFSSSSGQPELKQLSISRSGVSISAFKSEGVMRLELESGSGKYTVTPKHQAPETILSGRHIYFLLEPLLLRDLRPQQRDLFDGMPVNVAEFEPLIRELSRMRMPRVVKSVWRFPRPLATAPIRSRPKRTYDLLQEARSPEGDHIPMLLARLATTRPEAWRTLEDSLAIYGKDAGLFEDVIVRRFGKSDSAPFQLRVRLHGQQKEVNIVDVGYGVSQVLPILVEALIEQDPSMFLLQQPEVHLHPRAQAALGSFVARLVKDRRHRFIIETHSDYVIDRVRLAVRDGLLAKESVALLLLTGSGAEGSIQTLRLDDVGNILEPPPHYREFFLKEELRLLTS